MPTQHAASPAAAFGIVSRVAAAVLGGYAFASVAAVFLSYALPLPRADAVMVATLASFAVYVAAAVWAFAARSALRAWLGLLAPGAVMAAASLAIALGTGA